jgi:hypothetical protein
LGDGEIAVDRSFLVTKRAEHGECCLDAFGHAEKTFVEKVERLAFGHFRQLHPEYEVSDFKDGFRYLDFAYLRSGLKLAIDIDGYGRICAGSDVIVSRTNADGKTI